MSLETLDQRINRLAASRSKTGKVIFQDDFDNAPLGWDAYGTGTIAQNTTYKFMGKGCLGITTPATASGGQEALKRIAMPTNRRLGLEFYCAYQRGTENFNYLMFGIENESTVFARWRAHSHRIFGSSSPSAVTYANEAGTATYLTQFPTELGYNAFTSEVFWHHVKQVIDLDKKEYVSLEVDYKKVNLEGIKAYDRGTPTLKNGIHVFFYPFNSTSATACLTLIDEVVITSDEP